MKIKSLFTTKKALITIPAILLIVGATAWGLDKANIINLPFLPNESAGTENPGNGINYGPPTEEEKKETEQFKKDLENKNYNQSSDTNSPASMKQASVTMTYLTYGVGGISSSGFINNVFEDGGTCTLTLTKGSLKLSGTSSGIQDVNKTTCSPITINKNKLQSGEWYAVLSYKSSTINGSSPSRVINVP